LSILTAWTSKNVGSDHSKQLKMMKMLVVEILVLQRYENTESKSAIDREDRLMAMNYRLIQMVELGAKTVELKKSSGPQKLAMRSIAENMGFPTFLVELRHKAIHESAVSYSLLILAMRSILGFLQLTYWGPTLRKLQRRDD